MACLCAWAWEHSGEICNEQCLLEWHRWCGLSHTTYGYSSVMSNSLQPHGLQPARLLCPWNSPSKNTGVGSYSLLQGIFLTQGLNPGLPRCRQICCCLSLLYVDSFSPLTCPVRLYTFTASGTAGCPSWWRTFLAPDLVSVIPPKIALPFNRKWCIESTYYELKALIGSSWTNYHYF